MCTTIKEMSRYAYIKNYLQRVYKTKTGHLSVRDKRMKRVRNCGTASVGEYNRVLFE